MNSNSVEDIDDPHSLYPLNDKKRTENAKDELLSKSNDESLCPELRANIVSKILFLWAIPLIKVGYRKIIGEEDLESIPPALKSDQVEKKFRKIWKETKSDKKSWTLFRTLVKSEFAALIKSIIFKFIGTVLQFCGPLVLKFLLDDIAQGSKGYIGYLYAILFCICATGQSWAFQHQYWVGFCRGVNWRGMIQMAVYRKMLKLSSQGRLKFPVGQMLNMVSIDATRIHDLFWNPHDVWTSPLFLIANIILLFYLLGWVGFVAVGGILMLFPLNWWLAKATIRDTGTHLAASDKRIGVINEILNGIRPIKFYNWEDGFMNNVEKIREEELKIRKKIHLRRANTRAVWIVVPAFISLSIFIVWTLAGNALTPAIAFTILAIVNNCKDPIQKLSECTNLWVISWRSLSRIEDLLLCDELEKVSYVDSDYAISIKGDFSWDNFGKATLKELDLKVTPKKLYIVVGPVGCGKSSLFGTILGETINVNGSRTISGSIAYTSQTTWLINATLRDNITFGRPFDKDKYDRVIQSCSLVEDIKQLPNGDLTEIGERGTTLSGGQKHRVALARAVYQDEEIYLMDEPLGAVDPTVARKIFQDCIVTYLKNKTRILITHHLQFLPYADYIVVMKDGVIETQGTYTELLESGLDFAKVVTENSSKLQRSVSAGTISLEDEKSPRVNKRLSIDTEIKESTQKLISKEERATGSVSGKIFRDYFKAGGPLLFGFVVSIFITSQAIRILTDYLLVLWAASWRGYSTHFYLSLYALGFVVFGVLVLLRERLLMTHSMKSAEELHSSMLKSVLHAPIHFFDSTPTGRIVNRFSKDQGILDTNMEFIISDVFQCGIILISVFILVCILAPPLILPMAIISLAYYFVQLYYRKTSRELKRIEAISLSPIYSHFSNSANGASVIRAFGRQKNYIHDFKTLIDKNVQIFYWHFSVNRWLGMSFELINGMVVLCAAIFSVWSSANSATSTGLAGLSLSYTLSITVNATWLIRQATELEISMNAVSRILEYSYNIESEAPRITAERPPQQWPTNGQIQVKGLVIKHKNCETPVLKGVNCEINSNEKIGIVGRTGAGKSTLASALFRILEPAEGFIYIDGLDIHKMGLSDLRSRLSIIPQDPFLFEGTFRDNLDPIKEYSDLDIWDALQKSNLKQFVEKLPMQLESHIVENGENLSLGQRQLICLARAILRKSKILVLDEATAALDLETDNIIQTTVRREFAQSTVLTIAHRLSTIIDSDRVMVLKQGKVVEFDTPSTLLNNPTSLFTQLVHSTLKTSVTTNPI